MIPYVIGLMLADEYNNTNVKDSYSRGDLGYFSDDSDLCSLCDVFSNIATKTKKSYRELRLSRMLKKYDPMLAKSIKDMDASLESKVSVKKFLCLLFKNSYIAKSSRGLKHPLLDFKFSLFCHEDFYSGASHSQVIHQTKAYILIIFVYLSVPYCLKYPLNIASIFLQPSRSP